jgi:hypothetical protein
VCGAGEPPPGRDRAHRQLELGGIEQVAAAPLQPPPDPGRRRGLLTLEQLVEVTDGDVVRSRDAAGRQGRVGEMSLDVGVDARQQRSLPGLATIT